MGWEFEKVSRVAHVFRRVVGLPIKGSLCGASVKGACEPKTYDDRPGMGVCERCFDLYEAEEEPNYDIPL